MALGTGCPYVSTVIVIAHEHAKIGNPLLVGVQKTSDFGTTVSASKEPAITGILRVLGERDFGTGKNF